MSLVILTYSKIAYLEGIGELVLIMSQSVYRPLVALKSWFMRMPLSRCRKRGEVLMRVHATAITLTEFAWEPTWRALSGEARPFPLLSLVMSSRSHRLV